MRRLARDRRRTAPVRSSEIRILRDDVDVLAPTVQRLANSYARLVREMGEIRDELCAMPARRQRSAARARALEEGST
jgi:hypothetical protein